MSQTTKRQIIFTTNKLRESFEFQDKIDFNIESITVNCTTANTKKQLLIEILDEFNNLIYKLETPWFQNNYFINNLNNITLNHTNKIKFTVYQQLYANSEDGLDTIKILMSTEYPVALEYLVYDKDTNALRTIIV